MVDSSTICFRAKKFEIIAYDKATRASQQREIFKNYGKIRRRQLTEKFTRNNCILRFELKIKSVKQFNKKRFKGKIEQLSRLRDYFNDNADSLYNLSQDISFLDVASPEVSKQMINSQLEGKGKKEFNEYLIYRGLKEFGISRFVRFATPLLNSAIKLDYLKSLIEHFNSYRTNENLVSLTFFNKLQKRLESLKNRSLEGQLLIKVNI